MPQPTHPANYHAGLLRLWRDSEKGTWHASLQNAESGERLGFADLDHLIAYLLTLTGDAPPDAQGDASARLRELAVQAEECP